MLSFSSSFLNKAKLKFNKCGEIWAAEKFQVFATICSYCPAQFTNQQEFLKHLQQQHGDEVILKREKDIKMNGTEECTLDAQQSIVEDNMSKESGWTEDGEIDDDKKNATVNDQGMENNNLTNNFLNNSILKALEEYDVSTNLLNNLNKTDCEEPNENVLSNSIQNEKDEDNFDITMTEPCITSTRIEPNSDNIKSSGLKDLLEGLNDMQDLDGLLENFEESLIEMPIEHNDPVGEKLTMNAKKTENDENLKKLDANLELKDNIFKELDTFEKDLQIRNSQDAVQKDAEISTEVEELKIQVLEETLNPQTITNFNKSLENSEQLLNNFLNSHASLKSSTLKDNLKDTKMLTGQNLVKELEQHLNNPINSNTSLKTTKLLNNLKDSLKAQSQHVVKELKEDLNQETHTTLNNSLNNNKDFPPLKKFFNEDLTKALEEALEDNLSCLNDSALSRSLQNLLAQVLKEEKIESEKTNTSNSMENKEPILNTEDINPLGSLTNHKTNQNLTLKDSFEPTEPNEKTGQQNRLAKEPMEKDIEPEMTKESINTLNDSFPAIEEEVTTGKQNLLTHVPMEEDIEPEISKESINTIDSMINKQNLSLKDSFKSIEEKEKTGQKNVFAQELIEAETDQEMSKESINTTDSMINKQNFSLKDSFKSIEEKEKTGQKNVFAQELIEAETDQEMSKESINTTDSMINKQNLLLKDSLKSIEEKETTGQQNMFAPELMEAETDQEMSKESLNTTDSMINKQNLSLIDSLKSIEEKETTGQQNMFAQVSMEAKTDQEMSKEAKTSQNLTSNETNPEKDETVQQNSLFKEKLFVANSSEDLTLGQIIDQHKTHILASGNVEKSSQSNFCDDKYPAKSLKSTNPTKSEDQLEKYVVQTRNNRNFNTLSSKNETKTYSTESLKTEISKKFKATSEEIQTNSYIFNKEKLSYPQSIKTNRPKNSSEKSEDFKTQNNPNFNKEDFKILNNIKSKTLKNFEQNPQIELDNFNSNSAKNPEEYSQTLKRNIKLQETAATGNLEEDLIKLIPSYDKPDNITIKTLEKSVEDTQIFKLNLRQRKTSASGTKESSQKSKENVQILESSNKLEKKSSKEQPATDVATIADKPDIVNSKTSEKSEEGLQISKQNIELQKPSVKEDSEENLTKFDTNTAKPVLIKSKTSINSEEKPQLSKLNLRQRKTPAEDKSGTKQNSKKLEENFQIDQLNLKLQKTVVEDYTEENLAKFTTIADKPDYINSPEKSEEHPQTLKTNIKQQKSAVKGNTDEDLTNFSPNIDKSAGIKSKTANKFKEKPQAAKLNLRQRKNPATEKSETDLIKLTSINNKSEDLKSITPKNSAEASQIIESTFKLQKTTAEEDPEEDLTKFTSKTPIKSEESLKMLNTNTKLQKTPTEDNPEKDLTKSSSINNKPEITKSKTLKKSKEDSQTFETKIKSRKTPTKENSEDKPDHVKSEALNKPEETPQISKTNVKQQKRRVKENPEEDLRKLNDKPENGKSKTPKISEESSQILKTNIKQQKTPINKNVKKDSKTFTPRNNTSEIIKSKTPKTSKETSPILKSNIKQRKTRDKQNSVTELTNVKSITDKPDQRKSNTLKNSEETSQIVKPNLNIRKSRVIEKSAADITKSTPHLNFVNLERGDRSPLKSEELLIKQTAIAQGKNVNAKEFFTPPKDEKSIKTKEQMFLKQIIKMPGKRKSIKDEVSNPATTAKKLVNTSKIRNSKVLQKNIKSREKNNNIIRNKIQTTSGMIQKPLGRPKKFKALKQNLKSLENDGSIIINKTLKTLGKPTLSTPQFKKSRALQQDLKSLEKNRPITSNNIQTSTGILPKPLGRPRSSNFGKSKTLKQILKSPVKNIPITSNNIQTTSRVAKPLGRPRSSNFGKSKTLKQILKSPEKNIPITSNNIQTTSRVAKPLGRPRSSNYGKSKTFKQSLKSLQKNSPITRNKIQKTLGNPSRRSSTFGKSKSLKEKFKSPEKNETINRNKMQKSPGLLQKTEENSSVRPSNLTKLKPLKPGLQSLKTNSPIKRYKSPGNPIIKKKLLIESNLKQSKLIVAKSPSKFKQRILQTTLKSSKKAKQSIYPTLRKVVVKLRRFSLDKLREICNVSKTIKIPEEKVTFLKPLKKETTKLLKITKEVEETASSSKTKRKFTPSKEKVNDSLLNLENKELTTSPLKMGKKPLKNETTKLSKITKEIEETASSSKTKRKFTPSKENDSWLNLENKDLTKSALKTGKKDSIKCLVATTKSKENDTNLSPKFLSKEKESSFKTEQDLTQSKEEENHSLLDPLKGDKLESALKTEHDLTQSKEEENDSLLDPITGEIIESALNMEEKDPLEVPLTRTNFKEKDSALPITKEKNYALKPDNEKLIKLTQSEKEEKDPLNIEKKYIKESQNTKSKGKERAPTLSLQNKHSTDFTKPTTKAKEKYSSLKLDNKNVTKSNRYDFNLITENKSSADSTNSITNEKGSPLKPGNKELIKSLQSEKQKKDVTESPLKTKKKDSIKCPPTVTKSKGKEKDSTLSPQNKHSTHSTSAIIKAKEKKINVTKSNDYNSALSTENKFSTESTNSIRKEKDSALKPGDISIESLHSKKDENESSLNSKNKDVAESPLEIAKKDSIKSPLTGNEKDKCITESPLKNDKKDSITSPVTVIKSKGKEKNSTLSPPNKHSTDSTNPIIKAEEKESFLNPENINVSKSNEYESTLSTETKNSTDFTKPITKEKDSPLLPDYEELIEFLESDKEDQDSSLKSENKYITESPLKTVANSKEKEEDCTLSPQNKHSTDSTKPIIKANEKDSSFKPENINVTKSNEYDSTLSTENKYSTDFTSPITKEKDSSLMPDYEELIEFLAEEKDSSLDTENINVTKANEYESTLNTENNYSTDFTKKKDSPLMPDYEELIEFLQSEKEEKDSSLKSENKYITESPFKTETKDSIKSPPTVAKSKEKEEDSTFSPQNKHITGSTNPFIKAKEKDSSLNPENINVTKSNEYESTLSTENKYSTDFTNPITKGKDSPLMPDYEELIEFLQSEEEETEEKCITESPVKTEKDSIKSPLIVTKSKGKEEDSTLSPQNKQEKDSFFNPENLNVTKSNEYESTLISENKYSTPSANPIRDKNLIESLHSKKDENDSLSNLENKAKEESPSIKENNNSLEIPLTFTESKERENYSTLSPAVEHSTSSTYQIIEEKYCHLKPYIKDLPESLQISIKAKDTNSFLYLGDLNETESLKISPNLLAEDTVNKITLNPSITCTQTEENLAKLEIIKITKPIKSKIVTPRSNSNSKASATQKRIRKPSIASVTKQTGLNIQSSTVTQYNLNNKTYAVNRSPSKKQILKKLPRKRKNIAESVKHVEDLSKSTVKEKINIENICILPRLPPEVMNRLKMSTYNNPQKPLKFATSTKSTTTFSTTKLIKDFKPAKPSTETSTLDDKMFIEKSLKRPNTTALQGDGQLAKKPYKSSLIGDSSFGLPSTDSIEKYREAKAELMKSPGSDKVLDDLLQQVINESNVNEEINTHNSEITDEQAKISYLVDFDKHADLRLLNKFGLNIIKSPNIEDTYTFEQNEKMYDKAKHFAIIFKNYQLIWNIKNVFNPNIKLELAKSFRQLLAHVKQIFDSELTMMYLRRLVNLITCWYDHYCNVKVTAKDEISDGTNRYLLMFHYMPQNLKRTYYCEYCDELTIEECEYFTHRAVHTGHQYAFRCFICSKGFKFVKQLKLHQSNCGTKANRTEITLKTTKTCSKQTFQKPRTYSTVNQQTLQKPSTNLTVSQQTLQNSRTNSTVTQQTLQNNRTNSTVTQQTLQNPRTNSTVTQQTLQEPSTNLTVTQQTLQEHSTTVTTNYVLCSVCFAIFETSNQLSEHTKTHLNDN